MNLSENQFGHGGHRGKFYRVKRFFRPSIGKASIPYNWNPRQINFTIPIKNQFTSDSCGGQAKSYLFSTLDALQIGIYKESSAKSVYSRGYAQGGGMTITDLEKDNGVAEEPIVPSYQNGSTSEEFMTDTSWVNVDTLKNAMVKSGYDVVSVPIDIESIAEAIRDYGAIGWLIRGQNNGTWLNTHPQPPLNKLGLWGHFMCSHPKGGFLDNGVKTIPMLQSWGESVGDNGVQYFTETYINSGFIVDVFTFKKKSKFLFTQDLKFGDKNNDVLQLQKRLGVWNSGYFGSLTFAAVVIYQKWHGLPETGFVGPLTRASLNSNN